MHEGADSHVRLCPHVRPGEDTIWAKHFMDHPLQTELAAEFTNVVRAL